jgi:diguanylate cyclase
LKKNLFYNPNEKIFYKTILTLMSLSFLYTLTSSIFHWFDPGAMIIDHIVPPGMAVIFFCLTLALLLKPSWDIEIALLAVFIVIGVLAISVWYFIFNAYINPQRNLIDTLPPVGSILMIMSLVAMILLRTRHAMAISLLTWALVAVPVLVYLFGHPQELWSPRGKDLLITLGPALLLFSLLLPFQRGLRKQVEQLKIEHRKMQTASEMDALTKLYNRRAGERILAQLLNDKEGFGLILFDVDHFKSINDNYGHPAGDKVLQEIALRCTDVIRRDGHFSRWGGEEFVVFLKHGDKLALEHVAERLRLAINEQIIEPVGKVSASFGLAVAREFDSAESLLERADIALYQAKDSGRNCVVIGK